MKPPRDLTISKEDALKIAVFSDLQVDSDGSNFAYTMQLIQNVIDSENNKNGETTVDLVVLMGNTVEPEHEDEYQARFEEAVTYLKLKGIPWVSTGGQARKINRKDLVKADQKVGSETLNGENFTLSLTGAYNPSSSSENLLGPYTQRIPVYYKDQVESVFNLWILDSQGGYDCQGNFKGKSCFSKESVEWFKAEIKNSTNQNEAKDIIFTTIPLPEYI